jgi:UDP-N-acetylglucosamine 2-epimerase
MNTTHIPLGYAAGTRDTQHKIITLVGTRPELIKLSPVIPLLIETFDHRLVHSGQHYSFEMDTIFFEELHLPLPDYRLDVASGSHAEQTARILTRFERVLLDERPDSVIVLGDTNTALAGMLTTAKLHIPGVHLEAGCRSFNREMPEEINRIVADHVCDWCFVPGERERENLLAEGIPSERIYVVGSTAIDACLRNRALTNEQMIIDEPVLLTLHRVENTTPDTLRGIMHAINHLAEHWPFVFPVHPRTQEVLATLRQSTPPLELHPNIRLIEPVGYVDMLQLVSYARAVMTDSGGLQEEAATLGTPLLVVREETEWTYLVEAGAAVLVGNTFDSVIETAMPLLAQGRAAFRRVDMEPQRGAAERIVSTLKGLLEK